MRCGNIRIHVEIPIYADKNNCFCDDNHVSYSIPAIRKACETASNLPIIQYDEQGTEKVVGVAQSIKWNPLMKKIAMTMTSRTYYETGIETPEILGSGSSFSSVITTSDENEAFQVYRSGNRNYLLRVTFGIDHPRKVERWDEEQECWRT